jgi:ABC-2 type transport system permease protein
MFRGDWGDNDVWIGALVTVALGALLAWWGTRTFARQSA